MGKRNLQFLNDPEATFSWLSEHEQQSRALGAIESSGPFCIVKYVWKKLSEQKREIKALIYRYQPE